MGQRNEECGVGKKGAEKTHMIGAQPLALFVACPGRLLIWVGAAFLIDAALCLLTLSQRCC